MNNLICRRWVTRFALLSLSVALLALPSRARADGPPPEDVPLAEQSVLTLPNVVLGGGDLADVHFPSIPTALRGVFADTFPIVVLLQGANVDKAQYQSFGRNVARRGFVVVVANHFRTVPPIPVPGLFTATSVITSVLTRMQQEDADPNSPLHGIVDTNTMGLVGHSFGGVVGLFASAGVCVPPFCDIFPPPFPPIFPRPAALKAAVFYGTNLVQGGSVQNLNTTGVAVALMQGSRDGLATPANAALTYPTLEQPRALITMSGANHYGICQNNNPLGATPDPNLPTVGQSTSISRTAKWTALWLRAHLKADALAKFQIYQLAPTGGDDDDDEGEGVLIQTN